MDVLILLVGMVSIHAPTRGATMCLGRGVVSMDVSIHAPTRGATFAANMYAQVKSVSIHAPTRGATPERGQRTSGSPSFNPRAHAGRDLVAGRLDIVFDGFNPRAHAGRDSAPLEFVFSWGVSIHAPTRGATL